MHLLGDARRLGGGHVVGDDLADLVRCEGQQLDDLGPLRHRAEVTSELERQRRPSAHLGVVGDEQHRGRVVTGTALLVGPCHLRRPVAGADGAGRPVLDDGALAGDLGGQGRGQCRAAGALGPSDDDGGRAAAHRRVPRLAQPAQLLLAPDEGAGDA